MDCIIDLLDEGVPVKILYFDFRKAFGTVLHKRLLLKLKCLGINGKVLDIIKYFFSGRIFGVSVDRR